MSIVMGVFLFPFKSCNPQRKVTEKRDNSNSNCAQECGKLAFLSILSLIFRSELNSHTLVFTSTKNVGFVCIHLINAQMRDMFWLISWIRPTIVNLVILIWVFIKIRYFYLCCCCLSLLGIVFFNCLMNLLKELSFNGFFPVLN